MVLFPDPFGPATIQNFGRSSSLTGTTGETRFLLVFAPYPLNVLLEHQSQIAGKGRAIRIQGENASAMAVRAEQPLLRDGTLNAFRSIIFRRRLRRPVRLGSLLFELFSSG